MSTRPPIARAAELPAQAGARVGDGAADSAAHPARVDVLVVHFVVNICCRTFLARRIFSLSLHIATATKHLVVVGRDVAQKLDRGCDLSPTSPSSSARSSTASPTPLSRSPA